MRTKLRRALFAFEVDTKLIDLYYSPSDGKKGNDWHKHNLYIAMLLLPKWSNIWLGDLKYWLTRYCRLYNYMTAHYSNSISPRMLQTGAITVNNKYIF